MYFIIVKFVSVNVFYFMRLNVSSVLPKKKNSEIFNIDGNKYKLNTKLVCN